ncbi:MAG: hypothetical protein M9894_16785 [Planctomycetes bacterium]|nr:hypothetical protein [Planctomycetota bacterium]
MTYELLFLLLVWVLAAAFIVRRGLARPSGALTIAYLFNLGLTHWVAASIYVLDWQGRSDPTLVVSGFQLATVGVVALAVGVGLGPHLFALRRAARGASTRARPVPAPPSLSPARYVAWGLCCYFVLLPLLAGLPSVVSVASAGLSLALAGVVVGCWRALRAGDSRRFSLWLSSVFLFPVFTVITQGFLGYGVVAVSNCLAAVATMYTRHRVRTIAFTVLIVYSGLSVYVSYIRDRQQIRASVWGGQQFDARADRLLETVSTLEPFDPTEERHLRRIDARLNQNLLVGAAREYLGTGRASYALGETLLLSVAAVVPRAIWPDKPVRAGSMGFVTRFTGIRFAEGTSVGMGQVFEFYINFGLLGVFTGFILFGVCLSILDELCAARLVSGDVRGLLALYVPGLSLVQAGGALAEVTAGFAGGAVLVLMVHRIGSTRTVRRRSPRARARGRAPAAP